MNDGVRQWTNKYLASYRVPGSWQWMGMYRGMRPLWDVIHLHWVFSFFTPCIYQEMVTYFSSYSRRRRQPSACLKSESVKFNLFAKNIFSFRNLLSQFMIYLLFAWAKLYLLCIAPRSLGQHLLSEQEMTHSCKCNYHLISVNGTLSNLYQPCKHNYLLI